MRALVFQNSELRLERDFPMPERGPGEALVRVTRAGVCATDLEIIKGYMGFTGVPGHEFVGVVESSDSGRLEGRRVAGEINIACGQCDYCDAGLGRHCPTRSVLGIVAQNGAFAEYISLPEANLYPLPDGITDEEAVFIEPVAAAFEITEQLTITPDTSVCLLGDGRLGLLTAQVLALFTSNLTVIGRHPQKLAILDLMGIKTALSAASGAGYDVAVDCTGSADGASKALSLVKPRGTMVLKTTTAAPRQIDLNQLVIDEITVIGSRCGPFPPAIAALAGKSVRVKPLIDRTFPLEDGVRALHYAARKNVLKVILEI